MSAEIHASSSQQSPGAALRYFVGGNLLYNHRTGIYFFDELQTEQHEQKKPLIVAGLNFGKRYYFSSWMRAQLEGLFNLGALVNDTLYDYYASKYNYIHWSAELDLQLIRPKGARFFPFVLCGGGINYIHLKESTVYANDPSEQVNLTNYDALDLKHWAPHIHFGAGCDILFSRTTGINFTYTYRIWRPIHYLDGYDLPLDPVEYKENFLSHTFQIKLLFNFTESD